MEYNLNEFKDVSPTRGGKSKPRLSVGKIGVIRGNSAYIEENSDFKKAKSVDIKVMKKEDKVIMAINFLDNDKGQFSITSLKNKKGKITSKMFSIRSAFKKIDEEYKNFAQSKSIKLTPEISEFNNKKYYIVEISKD